ncbi:hypothetical protein [Streptomyces sp. NPDC050263]|uniref:hypothetical protein n=1 Tax=Streptomyces sp. NPDC050263 TaxID=3155037 RepID=UPI003434B0F4
MNADRETSHDMTQHDISLLLAEAAGEVEIGIAPTQALIRGGRRRRARRWAVATATALVVAGSTGALAAGGLPGGGGERGRPAATQPAVTETSSFRPTSRITLWAGSDGGKEWKVTLDVWSAPGDLRDARDMMKSMEEYGEPPTAANTPADLVGKSAYFVHRGTEENGVAWQHLTLHGLTAAGDTMSGADIDAFAVPLDPTAEGPDRLVIGHVARTARQVTCTWKDGTKTEVRRTPSTTVGSGEGDGGDAPALHTADGSPYDWFACLAPQGTEYESAEVTR